MLRIITRKKLMELEKKNATCIQGLMAFQSALSLEGDVMAVIMTMAQEIQDTANVPDPDIRKIAETVVSVCEIIRMHAHQIVHADHGEDGHE